MPVLSCYYWQILAPPIGRANERKKQGISSDEEVHYLYTEKTGKQVKRLRHDNGLEYGDIVLFEWLQEQGIHHEPIVLYSPEMNGISERSNGVINTKARALIADSGVNDNLWPEAIKT